jgi:hypothetical protein
MFFKKHGLPVLFWADKTPAKTGLAFALQSN